jgi:hypothetical protein
MVGLAVPVFISSLPLLFPKLKKPAAILLGLLCFLAFSSIGMFYIPATVLLAWPERAKWNPEDLRTGLPPQQGG